MKKVSKFALCAFFIAITSVLSKFTFSFVLGTHAMKFSGINFLLPLLGAFCGITLSSITLITIFALKFLCTKLCITLGIPTALATLSIAIHTHNTHYFARITNFLLHVLFPILCIALFCIHPVGAQAFAYSFYWFIPIALFIIQYLYKKNIFLVALQSTFIAHATGSIIVLYTCSLTAHQWLSLIPIVALERFVMASGMTLCMLAINYAYKKFYVVQTSQNNVTKLS